MLHTRVQRLCLISLTFGLAVFSFGLYQWFTPYRHRLVLSTQYIPDYPFDYMGANPAEDEGLIQNHRSCEWTSKELPEYSQLNSKISESVVVYDKFLTVDSDCAKKQIARTEPGAMFYAISSAADGATNPYWNAKLAAGFWDYENTALFKGMNGVSSFFGGEAPKSGHEYYKKILKDELQKTGYGPITTHAVTEQCIKAEPRWCVEKNRVTYFHLWRIVSSDWTLGIGAILVLIGVSGTLLSKPLSWLWSHTAGAIIQWVKHGE